MQKFAMHILKLHENKNKFKFFWLGYSTGSRFSKNVFNHQLIFEEADL